MRRLEGKVALISGTGRGRGRAAALRFAAEGALVVGGDLLREEAVETQRLIAREGGTALAPGPLEHTAKDGTPKILDECALPLTGERCVHRVITDLGVLDVTPGALALVETAPGVTVEDITARTGAALRVDNFSAACWPAGPAQPRHPPTIDTEETPSQYDLYTND